MPPKKPTVTKGGAKPSVKQNTGKAPTKKVSTSKTAPTAASRDKAAKESSSKGNVKGPVPKKWTKEDDAACKIQRLARQFLAKRVVERRKKEKADYELTIERLEKEAYVKLAKMQQEEAEREREKREAEQRERREEAKRKKRILEAAFDGDDDEILSVIDEVSQIDDRKKIGRDVIGKGLRARHIMAIVECEDANGNTPLSEAASGGHVSTIKLLLERNADVNTTGQFSRTPLFRAAFAGHLEACEVLLQNGADLRLRSEDAQTPEQVASIEGIQTLLQEWDIEETEKLLVKIEADKERRAADDKKSRDAQETKLEDLVNQAMSDYKVMEKQYCKASEQWNKRIMEHDKAMLGGFEKPDITLQAISDAEAHLEVAKLDLEKARDALQQAKLKLREEQCKNREVSGEVEELPGLKVNIRELDDVLLRDVGNRIKDSHKCPLVIDPSSRAATFLRYRDTNYLNALNHEHVQVEKIRMALLGGVRFGKPVVLDMMQVDMYESCSTRFDELEKGLFESILDRTFITEKKYLKLIRPTDGEQYTKNSFNDLLANKFSFVVVTNNSYPNDDLLEKMYPVRVIISD